MGVHEASAVLEVQGQENQVISLLLSSHKQQSTFPWDSAKEYSGQGRALSNRNVIGVPATKINLELLLVDLSSCLGGIVYNFREDFLLISHR